MQDLHDITAGGALLIIARSILQDVTPTECFTISTGFNQIQGLNTTTGVMLVVGVADVLQKFFYNLIFVVLVLAGVDSDGDGMSSPIFTL